MISIIQLIPRRLSGQNLLPSRDLLPGPLLLSPGLDGRVLRGAEPHDPALSPGLQQPRHLPHQHGPVQVRENVTLEKLSY